jgi:hypothetical protein
LSQQSFFDQALSPQRRKERREKTGSNFLAAATDSQRLAEYRSLELISHLIFFASFAPLR